MIIFINIDKIIFINTTVINRSICYKIGFNTDPDPDPAFYLNADPDHKVRLCHHKKLSFDMKNILYVGNMP